MKCYNFLNSHFDSTEALVCFKGLFWGKTGVVPDKYRLAIIDLEPRLDFAPRHKQRLGVVQKELERLAGNNNSYTVVHWRRGDQLSTRCRNGWVGQRDFSMNCKNATELIRDVRGGSGGNRGETVFVATNEKNKTQLDTLRSSGFIPLSDVFMSLQHKENIFGNLTASQLGGKKHSLDEFVMETILMVEATTLITYGISNVNDQIEAERRLRNKTWCVKVEKIRQDSWCYLYKEALRAKSLGTFASETTGTFDLLELPFAVSTSRHKQEKIVAQNLALAQATKKKRKPSRKRIAETNL